MTELNGGDDQSDLERAVDQILHESCRSAEFGEQVDRQTFVAKHADLCMRSKHMWALTVTGRLNR